MAHTGTYSTLGSRKAREILRHGEVGGRPLTPRQRRFMGARASGQPVRPAKRSRNAPRPKGRF